MNDSKRGTVWVLQESIIPGSNGVPMDYSAAERYGDVQFVLTVEPSKHDGSTINEHVAEELARMAMLYRENEDYIVLTGSPVAIFMAGAAIAAAGKAARMLVWNRKTAVYRPISLPLALAAAA